MRQNLGFQIQLSRDYDSSTFAVARTLSSLDFRFRHPGFYLLVGANAGLNSVDRRGGRA